MKITAAFYRRPNGFKDFKDLKVLNDPKKSPFPQKNLRFIWFII